MRHILFVCHHNAGRSQMAAAFLERHAPGDVRAHSAGTQPADAIWPEVREVMAEVGIELSERRPQKLTLEMQLQADWAVTMGCGDACPFVPTRVEDWDLADPAGQPLARVREIRDEVECRVVALLDDHLDELYTDRTAHELRLWKLLPALQDEFADTVTPERVRACADAALEGFADATVRSHVQTLAFREARECLAAGAVTCGAAVQP